MNNTCSNCKHACKIGVADNRGQWYECHRDPPQLGHGTIGYWPEVPQGESCGQHEAKPARKRKAASK